MDLSDLHLLEAVADRGSFSAAAIALRLSQPSVSARVWAVERAVGAPLFTRDSRGARLTPAGERYLGYSRRAVRLLTQAARTAAAESPSAGWTIGIPASYAPVLAPLFLNAAAEVSQPIRLRTGHSRHLRDELTDGLIDLAITHPGPLPNGFTSRHLIETPIIALAAADQPQPHRYAIHPWTSGGVEAVITELLGRGLPRTGISLLSPAATALSLAEHHGYLAITPQLAAQEHLAAGTLVPHQIGLPEIHAGLEWIQPASRPSNNPLSELISTVHAQLSRTTI